MVQRGLLCSLLFLLMLTGCVTPDIRKGTDMLFTTVDAAAKAARPISEEEEYFVGRAVAARIFSSYPLLDNKRLTTYINTMGRALALHSQRPFTYGGYHFAVLNSAEVNAFACPGGIILITRGMVDLARNEDELAAILAHEIAHINYRHGINSIQQSRWTEALSIIGTKAIKEYGPQDLSRLVHIFEGSIDDVFKTLVVNGYGISQEYMADEAAKVYLTRTGYDPSALIAVLERLESYGASSGTGIIKTHPDPKDRIENLKKKILPSQVDTTLLSLRTKRFTSAVQ